MARMPTDQFALRFPPGLRDRIKFAAATNRRSMNAEIVIALEKVFGEDQGVPVVQVPLSQEEGVHTVDTPAQEPK